MAGKALKWDETGKRLYETGVSHCALYTVKEGKYQEGVAWNGITNITETPEGAEAKPLYADNIKYLNMTSGETLKAKIEAYTYPEEFYACDGTAQAKKGVFIGQQDRLPFGLVYLTNVGNDTNGGSFGQKLHFLYGCQAAPSERGYSTINDSPEAITFSWELNTTPVDVKGYKPTSFVVVDSTKCAEGEWKKLLEAVYGSETEGAKMLLPDEITAIVTTAVTA